MVKIEAKLEYGVTCNKYDSIYIYLGDEKT